jgi:hypothetical protein
MDVFGYGTEEGSRPLMSPAICFICENSPTQEAERVIDTTREFNPECLTRLSGRKYVCEGCATEMGRAMGQVSVRQYEEVVAELRSMEDITISLAEKLDAARDEQHVVVDAKELFAKLEELTKKPPARTNKIVQDTVAP